MRALRKATVLLTLLLLLTTTSCVRMKASFTIKNEDRIEVSIDFGIRKDAAEQSGESITKETICSTDQLGMSNSPLEDAVTEPYDDGVYLGCKMSGWSTVSQMASDKGAGITLVDGVWTFRMVGDDSTSTSGASASLLISDFNVSVTFPGEVLTHNGSSTVDGKTVTWRNPGDLLSTEGLEATAKDGFSLPIWVWVAIGVVVLIAAAVGVVLFVASKKRDAAQQAAGYAQGQQPWSGQFAGQSPYPGQQQAQPGQYDSGQQYGGQSYGQNPGQPGQYDSGQYGNQQFTGQQDTEGQQYGTQQYGTQQYGTQQYGGQQYDTGQQYGTHGAQQYDTGQQSANPHQPGQTQPGTEQNPWAPPPGGPHSQ